MSLSDDELCLFRLLSLSRSPSEGDELPAKHGNSSASSPEPSVSSSVKTLSHEFEIRTATPGFAARPKPVKFRSNNTFGRSIDPKLGVGSDTDVATVSSTGSQVSVGSHSDIIVAQLLIHKIGHRITLNSLLDIKLKNVKRLLAFQEHGKPNKSFESSCFQPPVCPHNPSNSSALLPV